MTEGPRRESTLVGRATEDAYDVFAPLLEKYWGPDLHNGYWDDPEDDTPPERAAARLTEVVTDRLRVGPGSRVLDVGCGNGRPAVSLAARTGARVTGIDVNRRALRAATAHARDSGVERLVSFECADALRPPFPAGSFDAVVLFEVTPHFELDELFPALARLLRPSARLVLESPYARVRPTERVRQRTAEYYELIDAVSLETLGGHVGLAESAGLRPVEFRDVTEHTAPTWPRLLERLRRNWDEVERRLGAEAAEHAVRVVDRWREMPEIGNMIMTLVRADDVLPPG
ncbi:SAM-dependent methyltransferase [Actinopolyspora mortivallis]|uniref:SAM-dependent methyltransferase n=1 Tax=Actinopolyspora mortivallis TaxID=33906 RepID=UPI0003689E5F|nr:class I SAM-dependent methyltransferase [Actinopolyspora mortivallis]